MEFSKEFELMKKRMAKRRMEAAQTGSGGGGGGSGGEVRRIHIIYFLSRRGRIEHPHLIRVRHLSRNGVRLRDVKRWLSELRGKDMPESFAWSYKRKYKTGYLWQDLLDEDLITPISDNEYVLKGSEIPSSNLDLLRSHGEKKGSIQKENFSNYKTDARDTKSSSKQQNEHQQHPQQTTIDVSTKTTSSEIEEESPPFGSETSTLTDDSLKLEEEKHSDSSKQETTKQDRFENSSPLYSILLNKKNDQNKNMNNKNKNKKVVNPSTPASSTSTSSSSFSKSKSYSGGATNMFRSFITCGAVDTNDSVMVMINRRDKKSSSCYEPTSKMHENSSISTDNNTAEICKEDKLGGSERAFGTPWINQQQPPHPNARKSFDGVKSSNRNKSQFNNQQKSIPAAYKPINGPNCSQCGKMFKPEKMHAHMKSCRGMKSLAKGTGSAASAFEPRKSMDCSYEESVSGYYLANGS